jgi:hypothetical protein
VRRESLLPFVPAAIVPAAMRAVTDILTTEFVLGHQPVHPGRFIVFQVVNVSACNMTRTLEGFKSRWMTPF